MSSDFINLVDFPLKYNARNTPTKVDIISVLPNVRINANMSIVLYRMIFF